MATGPHRFGRMGDPVNLLLGAEFLAGQRFMGLLRIGEVERGAMGAIHTRLDLSLAAEIGPPAIAEGIFISADHISPRPGGGLGRQGHAAQGHSRRANHQTLSQDHEPSANGVRTIF